MYKKPFFSVCLLSILSACSNSEGLEGAFAPDPKLQESPVAINQSPETIFEQGQATPPPNFPGEIPLYPGAKLINSNPSEDNVRTLWATSDSPEAVQTFYRKELQANNWQLETPSSSNGEKANANGNKQILARQNELQVQVTIPTESSADNATTFTLQYSPKTRVAQSTATAISSDFSDLNQAPEQLRPYLKDLNALGVITTNTEKAFQPNETVTRREFARWLVTANNKIYANRPGQQIRLISESDTPAFSDIPKSDPDFAVIQGLAEAGLIPSRLTGDTSAVLFRPNAPLNREDLLIWKVPLDVRQGLPSASVDAVKETWGFQDTAKIEPKALRALMADYQSGEQGNVRRVFGYTTIFQPDKPVTQAEAAATLWYFGTEGEGISAQEALSLPQN